MAKLKLTTELIDCYRQEEVLWNIQMPEYKDKDKRKAALNKIALKFGVTATDIQTKINSFRTYYSREKAKVKASEQGTDGVYVSKWMYFEQLDTFLAATHFASQLSVSNLEPNVSIYITDEYADYFDYEDVGDDCDALQTSKDSTGTRKYPAAKHLTPKNNKKLKTINERTPHDDFMLAATEALRTATTSSSNKNETGADDEDLQQGKLFAMWLKKIKTPRLKRKAIQQMQEVIFRILDEDEEQQSNSQFNYSPHIYNHPPPTTNQPPPPINQPPPPINQPLPIISHHQINHHQ